MANFENMTLALEDEEFDNADAVVRRHGKLTPIRHEELPPPVERRFPDERFEERSFTDGNVGEDRDADAGRCVGYASVEGLRLHGTTGEAPRLRFERDEAHALRATAGIPPFLASRELVRKVTSDCSVEVDGNAYSVPWTLIGERVTVIVAGLDLRVQHAGQDVARHSLRSGRHGRVADPAHFAGIGRRKAISPVPDLPTLLRPLSEYDAVAGGAW